MGDVGDVRRRVREGVIWVFPLLLAAVLAPELWAGTLTFEKRLQAQAALERVAYRHRLWPQGASRPKPPFEELFPEDVRRRQVEEYVAKSEALGSAWQRPIAAEQLQAEIERMALHSRAPDVLAEMFAALNGDPQLIAECLARPILADRLARRWYAHDARFHGGFEEWLRGQVRAGVRAAEGRATASYPFRLPSLALAVGAANTWNPMTHMPAERAGHTLVWTGTEMIVWGGSASPSWPSYLLRSGGRYNPATDTWSLTSTVNAPAARQAHSAVWTGTEMIVWGGISAIYLNTGGRYDPNTDTWTTMALPPLAIKGRRGHSTVWTGTEMIIWGGIGPAGVGTSGGRYKPATNTWTATPASGLLARYSHSAVWTGAEMIVWGGHDYAMGYLNDGRRYNPATNTWTAVAAALIPRRYLHSAVWTGTQMVVWGGTGTANFQDGARYDPSTDTWATTSLVGAPAPNWNHPAVWTGALMLVPGGRYDPSTDTWTPMSAAGAYSARTAVWTGSEMIFWGGDSTASGLGARYSPTSDSWVPTATSGAPTPRTHHTAVWTGTEMVVWGGDANTSPTNTYYHSGGRYNPATDAWTPTSSPGAPGARSRHAAVWTGSKMIVWGGCDVGGCSSAGARYDPVADGWTPMSLVNSPAGRGSLTAVWTGAEMIVWGGYDGATSMNTGGRYDPVSDTWTPTSVANAPSGRVTHTAVWTGAKMIVWGGNAAFGSLANTGGRYDPVADAWTATSLVGAPDARQLHTSVWSGTAMIVWGGAGASFPLSPLGSRYDPVADTWTPISALGAPDERIHHVAVWTGAEMIVWAGVQMGTGDPLSSGGRYDPSSDSWTATTTVDAPSPRWYLPAVWTGAEMLVWSGDQLDGPRTYTGGRYVSGIVLTPGLLPSGQQGVLYNQPLSASGGTAAYTFAVTGGALPGGVMLSTAGLLAGTPGLLGTYTFTATATDQASRTGSRTWTLVIAPATPTASNNGPICAGATLNLTTPDVTGGTFSWTGPNGFTATIQNPSIVGATTAATGTYNVSVTVAGIVSAAGPTVATINPLPTATITPSGSTTFCAGGSVTLTASAGSSWLWSTGATTQAIAVTTSGTYSVTVTGPNGCSATSAGTAVTVNPLPVKPTITPSGTTTFCAGGSVTLTSSAGKSYLWSTGATTQAITVSISGSYTVRVTNVNSCTSPASDPTVVTVNPLPVTPAITAPTHTTNGTTGNVASTTAVAGVTYAWTLTNGTITAGATTNSITYTAGVPGALMTASLVETSSSNCASQVGTRRIIVDFLDTPRASGFHPFIDNLAGNLITAGCGGGNYCPGDSITRAQMSVFILRAAHGSSYVAPACTTQIFGDVPCTAFAAAWINEFSAEGYSSGCSNGNYCPNDAVTRASMSVFLLLGKHGPGYTPPACTTQIFGDVPCSSFAAAWINELAAEGITSGCGGGNYCPTTPVTREQLAVFIVTSFSLIFP